jgi:hypothetical protein
MWCAALAVPVQILFLLLCDVRFGIVSVFHQLSSISYVTKGAYLWKTMINIILTRPLLPPGWNINQMRPMWIAHHGQYCFRTADCLRSIVGDLHGPGARFVRADSRNKTRLRPMQQDISSLGTGWSATNPRGDLMQ